MPYDPKNKADVKKVVDKLKKTYKSVSDTAARQAIHIFNSVMDSHSDEGRAWAGVYSQMNNRLTKKSASSRRVASRFLMAGSQDKALAVVFKSAMPYIKDWKQFVSKFKAELLLEASKPNNMFTWPGKEGTYWVDGYRFEVLDTVFAVITRDLFLKDLADTLLSNMSGAISDKQGFKDAVLNLGSDSVAMRMLGVLFRDALFGLVRFDAMAFADEIAYSNYTVYDIIEDTIREITSEFPGFRVRNDKVGVKKMKFRASRNGVSASVKAVFYLEYDEGWEPDRDSY